MFSKFNLILKNKNYFDLLLSKEAGPEEEEEQEQEEKEEQPLTKIYQKGEC